MKVFDCTTFYNENMMLELRFNILDPYVDKFVITDPNIPIAEKRKNLILISINLKILKKKLIILLLRMSPKIFLMKLK